MLNRIACFERQCPLTHAIAETKAVPFVAERALSVTDELTTPCDPGSFAIQTSAGR